MADAGFLNWPFFDEAHRELAERLEAWCARELANAHHGADVDAECRALLGKLAEGGWLRYAVPSAYGGVAENLDVRSLAVIRETLARWSGLADFVFAMQGLGSGAVTVAGSAEQRQALLPGVARGELMTAFALTELASGSDVANMETSARPAPDGGWVLNGAKTYISNGGIADRYVVFARTGEAPGAKGVSAFLVPADAPGLVIAERIQVIAPHPLATLRFDDMRLAETALIGKPGEGFRIAMSTLDIFRSTVGAAALGFARRALDEAVQRATSRHLFGARLADQAVVQAQLADMALKVDAAALLVYRAAWTRDVEGRPNTREAAMAKLYATEAAQEVIDIALQIHGGLGVVSGVPVETLYREIRALRIYEGASEVQRVVIARRLLDGYAKAQPAESAA